MSINLRNLIQHFLNLIIVNLRSRQEINRLV